MNTTLRAIGIKLFMLRMHGKWRIGWFATKGSAEWGIVGPDCAWDSHGLSLSLQTVHSVIIKELAYAFTDSHGYMFENCQCTHNALHALNAKLVSEFGWYDDRAAQQAFAKIVGEREMDVSCALAMLYMADRKSILNTGFSITGDAITWTESGPALVVAPWAWFWWSGFCHCPGGKVRLFTSPGESELSSFKVRTLNRVVEKYAPLTRDKMTAKMKKLPEWKQQNSGLIRVNDILRAAGSDDMDITSVTHRRAQIESAIKRDEEWGIK